MKHISSSFVYLFFLFLRLLLLVRFMYCDKIRSAKKKHFRKEASTFLFAYSCYINSFKNIYISGIFRISLQSVVV